MKPYLLVPAAVLLVLLASTTFGQALVDIKPYTPPPDGQARANDRIGERGPGCLPDLPKPAGVGNGRAPSRGIDGRLSGPPRPGGDANVGTIGIRPPSANTARSAQVYLERHAVNVHIVDGVSITEIDQTFHNATRRQMEGMYTCPLPDDAIVNRFSIYMGKRRVRGVVMELTEARRIYDSIVNRRRDPGIVELIPGKDSRIRVRIFPIPPRGDMRVRLSYANVQDRVSGRYVTRVPLMAITNRRRPEVDDVSFSVQACSSWSLEGQMSGNYDLAGELTRHETRWNATFTAKRFRPSRDLQIRCKAKREKAGLALHVHRDKRGKTYFMAVVASGKTALRKPVLRILGVTTENVYPQRLSTVMPNRRVLVFGRILDDGVPVARLTAATSRGPVDLAVTKSDASDSRTSSFIAGFWARGRIDEVSRGRNHLRLGEDERTEVLALAVRHGILTPLTAILAK